MTLAACLALAAAGAAWWAPGVLRRFTASGCSPLFGITIWMLVVAAVLLAWGGAAVLVLVEVARVVQDPTVLVKACLATLEGAGVLWRSFGVAASGLTALLIPVLAVFAWRVVRLVAAAGRARRKLIRAVRAAGRAEPRLEPGAVLLRSDVREAYAIAGGAGTVVITTAALERLPPPQLGAVLAHERAHLAGRHQLLLGLLVALHRAAPSVPLFGDAQRSVALLLEMRADDVAAARHGRPALLAALLAMSGGEAPGASLGIGGGSVLPRARRLVVPAGHRERAVNRLAVSASLLGITVLAGSVFGGMIPQACTLLS